VAFFEADEWPYELVKELPMVRSRYTGKNGNYDCWFQARDASQQLMFYSRAPINATAESRAPLCEFFARANYGMVIGNFEMDVNDGEIRYKTSVDVEHIQLTVRFLKSMAYNTVVTLDRYIPSIGKVIYSDMTPAEAIAEAEGT
jgi:hypothetical protein